MIVKKTIVKSKEYDGVRLTIVGSQSSNQYYNYSDSSGIRYYVNSIGSTSSSDLESVTFNTYVSFTSSGSGSYDFDLVPMSKGETVILDMNIGAINSTGSKGYYSNLKGSYRHSGTQLSLIGSTTSSTTMSDFSTVSSQLGTYGTSSVKLTLYGQTSEVIDWNLNIKYIKSYHTLTFIPGSTNSNIWYPGPPSS